jgi:glycerol-3-phosphate dehydrogenase (NAD(P)+)
MANPDHQPIAILGAGSWGTALALYLAGLGQQVRLWTPDKSQVETMTAERANNRYLPGYDFPATLQVTDQLNTATEGHCDILIAVPSAAFREVIQHLKPHLTDNNTNIICATKGFDHQTGKLLHEIAKEILGNQIEYAILSGPSFAKEVAAGLPTAVVIASDNETFAKQLLRRFNSSIFRVYISNDMVGVEVGGVVKNVLAIATGISDGMQLGANARSALITRGLAEIIRLGLALGGQYETFTGLAGVGDLVLTCTDDQSRNRRFGLALGKGKTISEAEKDIAQVIEGKGNVETVKLLAKKLKIEMPITETVSELLNGKLTTQEAIKNLLTRSPKYEI